MLLQARTYTTTCCKLSTQQWRHASDACACRHSECCLLLSDLSWLIVTQVKSLAESTGEVDFATPSLAVQMVGLNSVPTAGDEFYVCEDETVARKAGELAEDTQVRF